MHEVSGASTSLVRPLRRVLPLQLLVVVVVALPACERRSGSETAEPTPGAPRPLAEAPPNDGPRRDVPVLTIFSEIREDSLTRGRDITIAAAGTRLVVKGRVRSEAIRRRALEIVRPHVGGLTLVDSLVVDPATPEPAP